MSTRLSHYDNLLRIGILLLSVIGASCPSATAGILKIMPLGDSITEGIGGSAIAGYRGPLYDKLIADGFSLQFVGSNTSLPGTLPSAETHHEGHSGYVISAGAGRDGLANHLAAWLAPGAADPDIILLMIGTNDINLDYDRATAPDRLSSLISTISNQTTGLCPNAWLIVAQITPINNDKQDGWAQAYNAGVASVVTAHRAIGEHVSIVDMHSVVSRYTDLDDSLHPNASGYNKMADVWIQGIRAVVPEPSTLALLASGLLSLLVYAWQKR